MAMARDAIGLAGLTLEEDLKKAIPDPNTKECKGEKGDIVTLVDIDFDEYKRQNDTTPIKKTLTIPSYLNDAALKAGLNFSQTLAEAIKNELHIA